MAKGSSRSSSDSDAKTVAPGITEALRDIHVTTREDDDPKDDVQATQQAAQDAEAEQQAAAAIDTQSLIEQGLPDDLASQSGTDPAAGTGLDTASLGSLGDRLGNAGQLQRLADQLSSTDAPTGDQAPSGHDTSMFAEDRGGGRPFVEGTTAPGAAVAVKSADGTEVDKVVAGDKSQTRDGVTGIPFLGGRIDDALTSAGHSAGTHAGAINQAANSDPTTNQSGSGSQSGSQPGGSQPGGTDSGSNPPSTGGESDDGAGVFDEFDNNDGSHTTIYNSGDIVTTYEDGTVEHVYPDGTTETDQPDGTLVTKNPDGSTETIHPDGTIDTTDPTPPPPPDDSDTSGSDTSGSDTSGGGTSGSDTSGGGTSGSGGDTSGSGTQTSAQMGTDGGGGGDPGDPESGAPLPAFLQQQVQADLAAAIAQTHPVDPGDGATDPNPDAGEPIDESGPIRDTKGILLGDPVGPGDPEFGAGSHGGDVGSLTGPGPGLDPTNSDPSPEADTGVQTTGPSERTTQQPVPGSFSPPTGSADSSDDGASDSSSGDTDALAPVSPLHGVLETHLLPDRLAVAADDGADDSPDDADG